jgi:hypothetical protein
MAATERGASRPVRRLGGRQIEVWPEHSFGLFQLLPHPLPLVASLCKQRPLLRLIVECLVSLYVRNFCHFLIALAEAIEKSYDVSLKQEACARRLQCELGPCFVISTSYRQDGLEKLSNCEENGKSPLAQIEPKPMALQPELLICDPHTKYGYEWSGERRKPEPKILHCCPPTS